LAHGGGRRARGRGLVWGSERARGYQRRWFRVATWRDKLRAIAGCFAHVLNLRAHRRSPRIAHHGQLLGRRPRVDTAAPTVVADAIALVVRNIVVVNIVNNRDIHVGYRAVVVDTAVVPIGAIIATASISIAVIDATVVADMGTPVARMPMVVAVVETPPWRRPECAYIGSNDPHPGYPIISGAGVAPVTRSPQVIIARGRRLAVLRERRRGFGCLDGLSTRCILIVNLGVVRISRRRCRLWRRS